MSRFRPCPRRRVAPVGWAGALLQNWRRTNGWMQTDAYLELAEASLAAEVVAPLRARGIVVDGGARTIS